MGSPLRALNPLPKRVGRTGEPWKRVPQWGSGGGGGKHGRLALICFIVLDVFDMYVTSSFKFLFELFSAPFGLRLVRVKKKSLTNESINQSIGP